jgi:hypothetical protein
MERNIVTIPELVDFIMNLKTPEELAWLRSRLENNPRFPLEVRRALFDRIALSLPMSIPG